MNKLLSNPFFQRLLGALVAAGTAYTVGGMGAKQSIGVGLVALGYGAAHSATDALANATSPEVPAAVQSVINPPAAQ